MTIQLDGAPPAPPQTAAPKARAAAPAPTVAAEPAPAPRPVVAWPVRERARRLTGVRLTGGWLAFAVVAAYALCVAIEPLPADPQPVLPWWYNAVGFALIGALITACVAAARNRPWAPAAVVVSGVLMVGATITCPASGHHYVLGWWWYAQLAISCAVIAAGVLARRRSRGA